ncbi:MAG: ergothioneine biosynthesis protein EgtB [Pseudomonadota bacterium]
MQVLSNNIEQQYKQTRAQSLAFCEPLNDEDCSLQAADFVSPPKWHLAHTSWFFETFLLKPFADGYLTPDSRYEVLFNSYYNGVGEQFPRPNRGLLSRPTRSDVIAYRAHVDAAMNTLLSDRAHPEQATIAARTTLGVEHERQHQELFFTDIKYSLAVNPLLPTYIEGTPSSRIPNRPSEWHRYEGGLTEIGHLGSEFCFDNELPRHKVFIAAFELADRLVTNSEYQAFIDDGGYQRPELWLSDGWTTANQQGWQAPQYWLQHAGAAAEYTLHGVVPREFDAPVCHVSGYEADAFARWAGARLPTEFEWELAAVSFTSDAATDSDTSSEVAYYHPRASNGRAGLRQLYGDCWQWTQSAYGAYPGFAPSSGAIGEYNGKFMSNQWVLRGSSCVTHRDQARASYRNFFYPQDRWQFSGIRLARNTSDNS